MTSCVWKRLQINGFQVSDPFEDFTELIKSNQWQPVAEEAGGTDMIFRFLLKILLDLHSSIERKGSAILVISSFYQLVPEVESLVKKLASDLGSNLSQQLLDGNHHCNSNSCGTDCKAVIANTIGALVKCSPELGEIMLASAPTIGSQLCDLMSHEDHEVRSNALRATGNMVNNIRGYGDSISNVLASNLPKMLRDPIARVHADAAWLIAIAADNIPDFPTMLTSTTTATATAAATSGDGRPYGKAFASILCEMLASPLEDVRCQAAKALDALIERSPEFADSVSSLNLAFAKEIIDVLRHKPGIRLSNPSSLLMTDNGVDITTEYYVSNALTSMILYVPGFRETILQHSSAQLGNIMYDLLFSQEEASKSNAARTLINLIEEVPGYADTLLQQHPNIPEKLCALLTEPDDDIIKGDAARCVGALLSHAASGFAESLLNVDSDLKAKLCHLLANPSHDTRSDALFVIAKLMEKVPGISAAFLQADAQLGSELRDILSGKPDGAEKQKNKFDNDNDDVIKSNAAYCIGKLASEVSGFGQAILTLDSSLESELCDLMSTTQDDTTKGDAAYAIGALVWNVPGFGEAVTTCDPLLSSKLCQLLTNPDDGTKGSAAMTIGNLVAHVPGFGESLVKDEETLGAKLCELLQNENVETKCRAALTIKILVESCPSAPNAIVNHNLVQHLQKLLQEHNNRTDVVDCAKKTLEVLHPYVKN